MAEYLVKVQYVTRAYTFVEADTVGDARQKVTDEEYDDIYGEEAGPMLVVSVELQEADDA